MGSLLRRLSGSRANSQTRLNKISQDNNIVITGRNHHHTITNQLGGSRTSLAKLGVVVASGNNSKIHDREETQNSHLVRKNFSASVQCLQNISSNGKNNTSSTCSILNSNQTSSNAHLFYTKNTPAPLVRGPGLNPKYRLANKKIKIKKKNDKIWRKLVIIAAGWADREGHANNFFVSLCFTEVRSIYQAAMWTFEV